MATPVVADIPSAPIPKSVVAVPHECDAVRASGVAAERGSDAPPSELLAYTRISEQEYEDELVTKQVLFRTN
jgi:hypothetical protein